MTLARTILALALPVAFLCGSARAPGGETWHSHRSDAPDRVELKNGSRLAGHVVFENEHSLVLRNGTREREVRMRDVESVDSRARHVREGIARWRQVYSRDVGRALDLSTFYRRVDLAQEADLVLWYVLAVDPRNQEAHEGLGHEERDGRWFRTVGERSVPFEALDETHAKWSSARVLPTEHYRLRTNAPLGVAVATAFDLECLYRSFFELFSDALRLYEVVEPMHVEVHAAEGTFHARAYGRAAYYDPTIDTVVVDASAGLDRGLLFHEAVHQLVERTARRVRAATGDVPAWLDEGLAEYVRHGITGIPGRAVFRESLLARDRFLAHARKGEGRVSALYALSAGDFAGGDDADAAYARASTFVHFALQPGRRSAFHEFLRGAYRGQSSPTHLQAVYRADLGALDQAWNAHVAATLAR